MPRPAARKTASLSTTGHSPRARFAPSRTAQAAPADTRSAGSRGDGDMRAGRPDAGHNGPGPGADVSIRVRLEPLHDVSLVGQAAAEEMDQERIRRVAGYRVAAVMVPPPSRWWWKTAGTPSPGRRPAAPLPATLFSRRRGARRRSGGKRQPLRARRERHRRKRGRRYVCRARQRGTGSVADGGAAGGCQCGKGYSPRRRHRIGATAGAAAIRPASRVAQSPDSHSLWKAASAWRRPVSVRTTDLALLTGSEISPFS